MFNHDTYKIVMIFQLKEMSANLSINHTFDQNFHYLNILDFPDILAYLIWISYGIINSGHRDIIHFKYGAVDFENKNRNPSSLSR